MTVREELDHARLLLMPIFEEMVKHLPENEQTALKEKVKMYYTTDVRSFQGLIIANVRLLVSEVTKGRKTITKLQQRLGYYSQRDLFFTKPLREEKGE